MGWLEIVLRVVSALPELLKLVEGMFNGSKDPKTDPKARELLDELGRHAQTVAAKEFAPHLSPETNGALRDSLAGTIHNAMSLLRVVMQNDAELTNAIARANELAAEAQGAVDAQTARDAAITPAAPGSVAGDPPVVPAGTGADDAGA